MMKTAENQNLRDLFALDERSRPDKNKKIVRSESA